MNDVTSRNDDHHEEITGQVDAHAEPRVVWRYVGIAAAASLIGNLLLYAIGRGAGWIPDDMPDSVEAFSLVSVVIASVLPVVAFGALMLYLGNHAPRASRLFAIILLVVLLLLVMVPFLFRDIDSSFRFVLVAMHIVTAASIFSLTQTTPR